MTHRLLLIILPFWCCVFWFTFVSWSHFRFSCFYFVWCSPHPSLTHWPTCQDMYVHLHGCVPRKKQTNGIFETHPWLPIFWLSRYQKNHGGLFVHLPFLFVWTDDYPPWFLWYWDKPFEPNVSIICWGRWPHHRLFWQKHPQSWYGFWWGKPRPRYPRSRSGFNCCNYQDQHSWLIFSDISDVH